MKNRLLSLFLALVMAVSILPASIFAADNTVSFNDIQYRYYEQNAIFWAEKGIISGDGSGAFKGEDPATRAEVAKILCTLLGYSVPKNASSDFYGTFTDVVKNAWYVGYLETLYNKGVMLGDGTGRIRPDAKISRQEMVTLICRAMQIEENPAELASSGLVGIDKVASWAKGTMGALIDLGAIQGDNNGNINAEANIKRGELVTLMSKLVAEYIEDGGTYSIAGKKGIVIVKGSPVTLDGGFAGNVIIAEDNEGARAIVNSDIDGKVISFAARTNLTVNGKTALVSSDGKGSTLTINDRTSFVQINGDSTSLAMSADAEALSITGDECAVNISKGKVFTIDIQGIRDTVVTAAASDTLVIGKDAQYAGVSVQTGGEIKSVVSDGYASTVSGGGVVGSALINGADSVLNTTNTDYTIGTNASNATSSGKNLAPGSSGNTQGSSAIVQGGAGGAGGITSTVAPFITKQPESIEEPLKFGAAVGKFSVEVERVSRHTYSYQWFISDTESTDGGVEIAGATSAEFTLPKQLTAGDHYVYCRVRAYASGSIVYKDTFSDFAKITVEKSTINILLIGGQAELGTNMQMQTLLSEMYKAQGVTANINNTVTAATTDMRIYSLFAWSGSSITGPSTSSSYRTYYNNAHTALAADAEVKYDYVVLGVGRTWNIAPRQTTSTARELKAIEYFENLVYKHNPDATLVIGATAGFEGTNHYLTDGGKPYFLATNRTDHMSRISQQSADIKALLDSNKVDLQNDILELGYGVEIANGSGALAVDAASYKSVTNLGSLLYAMMLFSYTTGLSPFEAEVGAWPSTLKEVTSSQWTAVATSAAEALSPNDSDYEVVFETLDGSAVNSIKAKYGDRIQRPASPTHEEYTFGGWYKDEYYSEPFNFSTDTVPLMGMTLYALWRGRLTEEPVITENPQDTIVRYATSDTLTVEHEMAPQHTYTYQWYVCDASDGEGTPIRQATGKILSLGRQYDLDLNKYYYCEVTANLAGSADGSKTVKTEPVNVTVEKGNLNILLIGGQAELGTNRNSEALIKQLLEEQGFTATVTNVITTDVSNTRIDQMFTWTGSGTSIQLTGFVSSGNHGTFATNLKNALAPDASVKYDYVVCAGSRTWNLITGQNTYIEREAKALEYIKEMVYEHNPEAVMAIVATAGYDYDERFGYDAQSVYTANAAEVTYILGENRIDHQQKLDARAKVLKDRLDGGSTPLETEVYRLGYATEVAAKSASGVFSSPTYPAYLSALGSYISGATIYSMITRMEVDSDTTTWKGANNIVRTITPEQLEVAKDAVLEVAFGKTLQYQLTFNTMGGEEMAPVAANKGEFIRKPADPVYGERLFDGWYLDEEYTTPYVFDENSAMPVGGFTLYAKWLDEGYVRIYTEYYFENANDNKYTFDESRSTREVVLKGSEISVTPEEVEGFTFSESASYVTESEAFDGLTLKVYYNRNSYTVSYTFTGTVPESGVAAPRDAQYKYESAVKVGAANFTADGYIFLGWESEDVDIARDGTFAMPARDVEMTGRWVPEDAELAFKNVTLNGSVGVKTNKYIANSIEISGDISGGFTVTGTVYPVNSFSNPKVYGIVVTPEELVEGTTLTVSSMNDPAGKTYQGLASGDAILLEFAEGETNIFIKGDNDSAIPVTAEITLNVAYKAFNYYMPMEERNPVLPGDKQISVYMAGNFSVGINDMQAKLAEVAAAAGYDFIVTANEYFAGTANVSDLGIYEMLTMSGNNPTGWNTGRGARVSAALKDQQPDFFVVSSGRAVVTQEGTNRPKSINGAAWIEKWLASNCPNTKLIILESMPFPTDSGAFTSTSAPYAGSNIDSHTYNISKYVGQIMEALSDDSDVVRTASAFWIAVDQGIPVYNASGIKAQPSDLGTYFIAYQIFSRLTGTEPVAVSEDHDALIDIALQTQGFVD